MFVIMVLGLSGKFLLIKSAEDLLRNLKHIKAVKYKKINLSNGQFQDIYTECNGINLNGPNDIVFDKKGNFWFTDLGKLRSRTMDETLFIGLKEMNV